MSAHPSRRRKFVVMSLRAAQRFASAIALTAIVGVALATPATGPVVETAQGPVRGISGPSMELFLGIPYAAPPIGKLRFAPPDPPAVHTGVLDATKFGDACPQPPSAFSVLKKYTSENCLFLNVYTPGTSGHHAVMVWIHGGAFVLGSGAQYDPAPLVRDGVVVVTINYRLGLFGFLADSALSAESPAHASGNYGLMDQVAALRWVKANIAKFGGDPSNVTIFGQSAGGMSVIAQLINPHTTGLFEKGIIEAGAFVLKQPTLTEAEATGRKVAKALGCDGEGQAVATCLRALPADKIVALETSGDSKIGTRIGANLRPDDFPESVEEALASGHFHHLPVIEGSNSQGARFFVSINLARGAMKPLTASTYEPALVKHMHVPSAIAERIAAAYPATAYSNADYALSAAMTDSGSACKGLFEISAMSKFAPTYAYEFADTHAPILPLSSKPFPVPQGFHLGAAHLAELQDLFDVPTWYGTLRSTLFTPSQAQLADAMVDYWTNFAKSGNPNSPSGNATDWPRYDGASHQYIELVPPSPIVISNFATTHKCNFWAGVRQSLH